MGKRNFFFSPKHVQCLWKKIRLIAERIVESSRCHRICRRFAVGVWSIATNIVSQYRGNVVYASGADNVEIGFGG